MEMCYDGALVMPNSYVVMSEDEMTYVEGGFKAAPTWLFAGIVNLAIDVLVAGVCNFAVAGITVLTWASDPGGSLASYIDSRDKKPGNRWIDI